MAVPLSQYHSQKYSLNQRFFDSWSASMAYVLGFWFADGYMRHDRSYRIVFVSNDKGIIVAIRRAFRSRHPIRKRAGDNTWSMILHSKYLYFSLMKRGGFRQKSRTIRFPKVPRRYLRDFIRGYFDGDGSVFFVEYTRTKDGRRTRELRTNFTSGSRGFLEDLMMVLRRELGFSIKILGAFNKGASLKLGYGMRDSEALLRYMYYDRFPIGLRRKAIFVDKIPAYQKHARVAEWFTRRT